MARTPQALSPESARRYYGSKPEELKKLAADAQKYLNYVQQQLVNGPPDVDPSFGLDAEKLNAGWVSNMERQLKQAQEWVAEYAEMV